MSDTIECPCCGYVVAFEDGSDSVPCPNCGVGVEISVMPNVLEIVKAYVIEHGFDGLYCPGIDCGCFVNDLAPCCEYFGHCDPGYKIRMVDEGEEVWGIGPTRQCTCGYPRPRIGHENETAMVDLNCPIHGLNRGGDA